VTPQTLDSFARFVRFLGFLGVNGAGGLFSIRCSSPSVRCLARSGGSSSSSSISRFVFAFMVGV